MAALNPNNQQQPDKRIIGFDCEFVKPPPSEYIQSECPVCLQIIREPYQVKCCGNKFCKACIRYIKVTKKPCPTCKEIKISSVPDKGLKQSLYSLKVRCSHQKDGCEWTGELRQLDEHLNTDPEPEKQLDGCQFVKIDCIYNCGNYQQRRYIQVHQNDRIVQDCPKRPFGCEHCHDYQSTYDDVTNNHWPVCGSFPVPCPNQCGSTTECQNIDSHVADECPLTTINCDFHYVGCAVKLPRQDMPEHLRENLLTHISLLATSHAKQQAETTQQREEITKQQAEITNLVDENKILQLKLFETKKHVAGLQTKATTLEENTTSDAKIRTALQTKVTRLEQENTASDAEIRTNLTALQTKVTTLEENTTSDAEIRTALQTKVTRLEQENTASDAEIRTNLTALQSKVTTLEANTTSDAEIRTALQTKVTRLEQENTNVTALQNKVATSKISLDALQKNVTTSIISLDTLQTKVTRLNQKSSDRIAEINSSKTILTALQTKVIKLEQDNKSLSSGTTKQQADIATLVEENKQLKMKIAELAPLQQMLSVNSRPLGAPVLTMTNFRQHKRDDHFWYSPPVYTHHQGYKICLKMNANGRGSGERTHVSVFVHFMRGEFDNSLKWPFRGVISYQLLDQVDGEDHKTHTITYSDTTPNKYCTRVTEGERADGWGHGKFIAHAELEPKYLRNDILLFRIHKVELI